MLLAILLLGLVSSPAVSPIRFADIPWGTDGPTVARELQAREFALLKVDAEGDYLFEGHVLNHRAIVTAYMAGGRLAKVTVALATPGRDARSAYGEAKRTLTSQYGAPEAREVFEWPYEAGDGHEDVAIRMGKAKFLAFWHSENANGREGVGLEITPRLIVRLFYESPQWIAEAARRGGAGNQARPSPGA
jgi:hypothetical protein